MSHRQLCNHSKLYPTTSKVFLFFLSVPVKTDILSVLYDNNILILFMEQNNCKKKMVSTFTELGKIIFH